MDHKSIIYAELSLGLPINKKGEGAQNHKHGSTGPISLLVCTDELTVKDGSILVASLDLLKDGLNQSTLRKKKPCKTFFFPLN